MVYPIFNTAPVVFKTTDVYVRARVRVLTCECSIYPPKKMVRVLHEARQGFYPRPIWYYKSSIGDHDWSNDFARWYNATQILGWRM